MIGLLAASIIGIALLVVILVAVRGRKQTQREFPQAQQVQQASEVKFQEAPIEMPQERQKKPDYSFSNKVIGLPDTPLGTGWRTFLHDGETRTFDGIAVLSAKGAFKVRIDMLDKGRREKLGYLSTAELFKEVCVKVNPDSDMGRAIAQKAIPCRVLVYLGDIHAAIETDHYSCAYTDLVQRVRAAIKKQKMPKAKANENG